MNSKNREPIPLFISLLVGFKGKIFPVALRLNLQPFLTLPCGYEIIHLTANLLEAGKSVPLMKFLRKPRSRIFYFRLCFALVVLGYGLGSLAYGLYGIGWGLTSQDFRDMWGKDLGRDFVGFYAGAKLAWTDPAAVFSVPKFQAMREEVMGRPLSGLLPWSYPPVFLVMVMPLAFLPYKVAYFAWMAATLYGYWRIIHRIAPHPATLWLFLAFPGVMWNIGYGQNGFLAGIFLGGGLLLMERRPWAGGVCLGLLCYKPQLALLVPIALAAGRHWRTLTAAGLTALGAVLASILVLGWEPWVAFWKNLNFAKGFLHILELRAKMPTVFTAAHGAGASAGTAAALQMLGSLTAAALVAWAWLRRASLPLRGSLLVLAIFLTTPYAFESDLALLALPMAWLGWEAYRRRRELDEIILAYCWVGLLLAAHVFKTKTWQTYPVVILTLLSFTIYRIVHPGPSNPSSGSGNGHRSQ